MRLQEGSTRLPIKNTNIRLTVLLVVHLVQMEWIMCPSGRHNKSGYTARINYELFFNVFELKYIYTELLTSFISQTKKLRSPLTQVNDWRGSYLASQSDYFFISYAGLNFKRPNYSEHPLLPHCRVSLTSLQAVLKWEVFFPSSCNINMTLLSTSSSPTPTTSLKAWWLVAQQQDFSQSRGALLSL